MVSAGTRTVPVAFLAFGRHLFQNFLNKCVFLQRWMPESY